MGKHKALRHYSVAFDWMSGKYGVQMQGKHYWQWAVFPTYRTPQEASEKADELRKQEAKRWEA